MAGIFYPESASETNAALDAFSLYEGEGEQARAIIAPHASWEISGRTAAMAFKAAAGRDISRVVIIGPLHERSEEGIFLSDSTAFETPLGDIVIDTELSEELGSCGTNFVINDIPHLSEHSIEILLPFIKRCFPRALLVPILLSGSKPSLVSSLARGFDFVFAPIIDSVLFVISSNLSDHLEAAKSHSHSDTFLKLALDNDRDGILSALDASEISACGAAPCAALLGTQLMRCGKRIVAESSSSDKDDEESKLVRYAAIAYD
ncbi:AmmeMemoRadiSam system protein B [Treponema sp.]